MFPVMDTTRVFVDFRSLPSLKQKEQISRVQQPCNDVKVGPGKPPDNIRVHTSSVLHAMTMSNECLPLEKSILKKKATLYVSMGPDAQLRCS